MNLLKAKRYIRLHLFKARRWSLHKQKNVIIVSLCSLYCLAKNLVILLSQTLSLSPSISSKILQLYANHMTALSTVLDQIFIALFLSQRPPHCLIKSSNFTGDLHDKLTDLSICQPYNESRDGPNSRLSSLYSTLEGRSYVLIFYFIYFIF